MSPEECLRVRELMEQYERNIQIIKQEKRESAIANDEDAILHADAMIHQASRMVTSLWYMMKDTGVLHKAEIEFGSVYNLDFWKENFYE